MYPRMQCILCCHEGYQYTIRQSSVPYESRNSYMKSIGKPRGVHKVCLGERRLEWRGRCSDVAAILSLLIGCYRQTRRPDTDSYHGHPTSGTSVERVEIPTALAISSVESLSPLTLYSVFSISENNLLLKYGVPHREPHVGREKNGQTGNRTRDNPKSRRAYYHCTTQPVMWRNHQLQHHTRRVSRFSGYGQSGARRVRLLWVLVGRGRFWVGQGRGSRVEQIFGFAIRATMERL
jgi:hypothetical protein